MNAERISPLAVPVLLLASSCEGHPPVYLDADSLVNLDMRGGSRLSASTGPTHKTAEELVPSALEIRFQAPVPEGRMLEEVHFVTHPTGEPARLGRVIASCDCTEVEVNRLAGNATQIPVEPGALLLPGERLEFRRRVDTRGKSGRFVSAVEVTFEEPAVRFPFLLDVEV